MSRSARSIALFVLALAMTVATASAKRKAPTMISLADSASVYQALYSNTPIEPEFMLVPKFAIVGGENKFVFSTGASLKFTACFDWGNPVRNPSGMGVSAITPAMHGDNTLYQMSAGGSGIFFNIIGFPGAANQIGLFISIGVDTDGNNTYHLGAGQVYMRYRDFQCGYSTSLYNDRGADAYIIDSHGPCASGAHNTVGMNWQHFISKHFRVGVGVESPAASYTQVLPKDLVDVEGMGPVTSHQNIPDFPMYVGYAWKHGHVRLSSVYRTIHSINYANDHSEQHPGWGLKLTGKCEAGPVNLFWMTQGGRSIASYFNDNAGNGLDLVPGDDTYKLKATHSWGFITGVQYRFSPKLFATAQVNFMRNYIPRYKYNATTAYDNQMRRGYSTVANVVWRITPLFSAGLEYRHGCRTDETRRSLSDNRIYAMLLMTF